MVKERGNCMKSRRILLAYCVILMMLLLMVACNNNEIDTVSSDDVTGIFGSWSYIHDKETRIALFRENGMAEYKGKDYSFEWDSQFIMLKDKDGETIQLRYAFHDGGMYLYSKDTYSFCGEGDPGGLIGEWSCGEKNWSYTFTDTGTFLEDGYFPGYYTVDDENSTVTLEYIDQFEDTVCYFRLEENNLHIQYPWRMVRIGDK